MISPEFRRDHLTIICNIRRNEGDLSKYYKTMYNGNIAEDRNYSFCLEVDRDNADEQMIYHGKNITKQEWGEITFHCNLKESVLTDWLGNIYNWELFSDY